VHLVGFIIRKSSTYCAVRKICQIRRNNLDKTKLPTLKAISMAKSIQLRHFFPSFHTQLCLCLHEHTAISVALSYSFGQQYFSRSVVAYTIPNRSAPTLKTPRVSSEHTLKRVPTCTSPQYTKVTSVQFNIFPAVSTDNHQGKV